MKVYQLEAGAKVFTYDRYRDNRGWFSESWSDKWKEDAGIEKPFVQTNIVWTERKNTIRGLHSQMAPAEVSKYVQVIKGRILDVFVDAREGSDTFGKWWSYELTEEIPQILCIPKGFYHGYMTLEDNCIVHYQQDEFFTPSAECGLKWDDPTVNIDWGLGNAIPVVSEKDNNQKLWQHAVKF